MWRKPHSSNKQVSMVKILPHNRKEVHVVIDIPKQFLLLQQLWTMNSKYFSSANSSWSQSLTRLFAEHAALWLLNPVFIPCNQLCEEGRDWNEIKITGLRRQWTDSNFKTGWVWVMHFWFSLCWFWRQKDGGCVALLSRGWWWRREKSCQTRRPTSASSGKKPSPHCISPASTCSRDGRDTVKLVQTLPSILIPSLHTTAIITCSIESMYCMQR